MQDASGDMCPPPPSVTFPIFRAGLICEPSPVLLITFADAHPWKFPWWPHDAFLMLSSGFWGFPGGAWGASSSHLAANHGLPLDGSVTIWKAPGGVLGSSWIVMGFFGPSWGTVRPSWGSLRMPLSPFGCFATILGDVAAGR
eukprot:1818197-Pyramimonas_sp.AAC.2